MYKCTCAFNNIYLCYVEKITGTINGHCTFVGIVDCNISIESEDNSVYARGSVKNSNFNFNADVYTLLSISSTQFDDVTVENNTFTGTLNGKSRAEHVLLTIPKNCTAKNNHININIVPTLGKNITVTPFNDYGGAFTGAGFDINVNAGVISLADNVDVYVHLNGLPIGSKSSLKYTYSIKNPPDDAINWGISLYEMSFGVPSGCYSACGTVGTYYATGEESGESPRWTVSGKWNGKTYSWTSNDGRGNTITESCDLKC